VSQKRVDEFDEEVSLQKVEGQVEPIKNKKSS
jgi:hypothetical protein